MADQVPAKDPPVEDPESSTPPAQEPNPSPTPQPEGEEKDEDRTFPLSYVERLRHEAADWRVKFRDAEKQLETRDSRIKELEGQGTSGDEEIAKRFSELESLQNELRSTADSLFSDLTEAKLENMVIREALHPEINIQDPDAAFRLLDRSKLKIEDGVVLNLHEALQELTQEKPWLVSRKQPPKVEPTNPSTGKANGGLTIDQIKAMSKDEINRRWDEVSKVLATQGGQ